jgi:hypothetical protein
MRHRIALFGTALIGAGVLSWGTGARAQEEAYVNQPLAAPSNAFELQLSTGYTQGLGNIAPATPIVNVAGAGIGFTADFGYRVDPYVSVGAEGQYQTFIAENSSRAQGLAANIGVTMHAMPESRGDPWLRLGTGYRMLWQSDPTGPFGLVATNTTNMFHGFDLINARIGYDIRATNAVAFAPMVGANLQTFIWEDSRALSRAQWGTFLYAGLQGRFDAGGSTATNVALAGTDRF